MESYEFEVIIDDKKITYKIQYIKYALVELYKNVKEIFIEKLIFKIMNNELLSMEEIDLIFNRDIEDLIKEDNQYKYLYKIRLLVNIKKIYENDINKDNVKQYTLK